MLVVPVVLYPYLEANCVFHSCPDLVRGLSFHEKSAYRNFVGEYFTVSHYFVFEPGIKSLRVFIFRMEALSADKLQNYFTSKSYKSYLLGINFDANVLLDTDE